MNQLQGSLLASDRTSSEAELFTLEVLRCNPEDSSVQPHWQRYSVELSEGMTLFIALSEIREQQDPSLQFDFVCRAGICGSCAMLINGRPGLACRTLLSSLPSPTRLAPLPGFALIGDLSVDTGRWMRSMSERLQIWVEGAATERDPCEVEEPMEPTLAEEIYELDRCIECGCCVAACGTAQMRDDFVGAVGLNKLARLRLDPRDDRDDAAFYELIGDDDGVFGCMSLLGCEDVCPKDLSLGTQIAYLRRAMLREAL
ncbi:fumarate reductase iron-sulfur subunit [gamma proteobacterium NOR5-3]|nr:fumarate reductase iron-sulfur subunit [gamma proteobacterium NOR5-3]